MLVLGPVLENSGYGMHQLRFFLQARTAPVFFHHLYYCGSDTSSFVQLLGKVSVVMSSQAPCRVQCVFLGGWFMFVLLSCPSVWASHYTISHWPCIKQCWVLSEWAEQFRQLRKLKK